MKISAKSRAVNQNGLKGLNWGMNGRYLQFSSHIACPQIEQKCIIKEPSPKTKKASLEHERSFHFSPQGLSLNRAFLHENRTVPNQATSVAWIALT